MKETIECKIKIEREVYARRRIDGDYEAVLIKISDTQAEENIDCDDYEFEVGIYNRFESSGNYRKIASTEDFWDGPPLRILLEVFAIAEVGDTFETIREKIWPTEPDDQFPF